MRRFKRFLFTAILSVAFLSYNSAQTIEGGSGVIVVSNGADPNNITELAAQLWSNGEGIFAYDPHTAILWIYDDSQVAGSKWQVFSAGAGADNQNLSVGVGTSTTSIIEIENGTDVTLEAGSGIALSEGAGTIAISATAGAGSLSQEEVEDYAFDPLRFGNGVRDLITVTYDDANNEVDFEVDNNLANYDNTTSGFITSETDDQNLTVGAGTPTTSIIQIEDGTDVTLEEGTNISLTELGNTITIDAVGDGTGTDDQNIQGGSFATGTGDLTIGIESGSSQVINLDGRYLETEVDGAITNEGSLTVAAGTATTSLIQSNTSGSTDVTLEVGTGLSISEAANTITLTNTVTDTDTQLSQEQVEDYAGAMVTGNTETLIDVTYQDVDGTVDYVVNDDLSLYDNTTSNFASSTDLKWEDVDASTITTVGDDDIELRSNTPEILLYDEDDANDTRLTLTGTDIAWTDQFATNILNYNAVNYQWGSANDWQYVINNGGTWKATYDGELSFTPSTGYNLFDFDEGIMEIRENVDFFRLYFQDHDDDGILPFENAAWHFLESGGIRVNADDANYYELPDVRGTNTHLVYQNGADWDYIDPTTVGTDDQNLTVGAGTASTSIIEMEDGTDVTLEAGSGITIAEAGSTITITASGGGGGDGNGFFDATNDGATIPTTMDAVITDNLSLGNVVEIDEASDEVGINEGTPTATLHVTSEAANTDVLKVTNSIADDVFIVEQVGTNQMQLGMYHTNGTEYFRFSPTGNGWWNTNGNIGMHESTPTEKFHIGENTRIDASLGLNTSPSRTLHALMNNTDLTSIATFEQDGTGDAAITFDVAAQNWTMGIDNSVADNFAINPSTSVTSSSPFIIETDGDVKMGNDVSGTLNVGSFTTTERDALTDVANGDIIYNETTNEFQVYENGAWATITGGGGGSDGNGFFDVTNDGATIPSGMDAVITDNLSLGDVVEINEANDRVGIDETTPDAKLHVHGSNEFDMIVESALSDAEIYFAEAGNIKGKISYDTSNNAMEFMADDTNTGYSNISSPAMVIEGDTQDVGIGTSSPGTRLHVDDNGTRLQFRDTGGLDAELKILGVSGQDAMLYLGDVTDNDHAGWFHDQSLAKLITRNNGAEVGAWDDASFAIGSTTASATLDVAGDFEIKAPAGNATHMEIISSANFNLMSFRDSNNDGILEIMNQSGATGTLLHGDGNSYFNAGNLGVGTTTPGEALEVVGTTETDVLKATDRINLTATGTEPSTPSAGDIYLDDGTNHISGVDGLRYYDGTSWSDIGVGIYSEIYSSNLTTSSDLSANNKIDFTNNVHDLGAITNDVTTNERITIDVTGLYEVTLSAKMDGAANVSGRLEIRKNGTALSDLIHTHIDHRSTNQTTCSSTSVMELTATDYLEVYLVWEATNGNIQADDVRLRVKRLY